MAQYKKRWRTATTMALAKRGSEVAVGRAFNIGIRIEQRR